jgi:putative spermidine/putrescine transport system permease protein
MARAGVTDSGRVVGAGLRGPAARVRGGTGTTWLLTLPTLFFVVALVLPLFFVFKTALSDGGAHTAADSVTSSLFVSAMWRTLLMATCVAFLCMIFGLVYSLGLALASGWLRGVLLGVVVVSFSISLLVRTYGWVLIYQPNGLLHDVLATLGLIHGPLDMLKTTRAMYPAMVHIMLPYMILPVYSAVSTIDRDQLRAAQSLGAPPGLLIRKVLLPQLRSGLAAGWILVFILSLGFFVTPAVLGGPENLTLATVIDQQFSQLFDFASASAMGASVLITVLVIYLLADKLLARAIGWQGD